MHESAHYISLPLSLSFLLRSLQFQFQFTWYCKFMLKIVSSSSYLHFIFEKLLIDFFFERKKLGGKYKIAAVPFDCVQIGFTEKKVDHPKVIITRFFSRIFKQFVHVRPFLHIFSIKKEEKIE